LLDESGGAGISFAWFLPDLRWWSILGSSQGADSAGHAESDLRGGVEADCGDERGRLCGGVPASFVRIPREIQ